MRLRRDTTRRLRKRWPSSRPQEATTRRQRRSLSSPLVFKGNARNMNPLSMAGGPEGDGEPRKRLPSPSNRLEGREAFDVNLDTGQRLSGHDDVPDLHDRPVPQPSESPPARRRRRSKSRVRPSIVGSRTSAGDVTASAERMFRTSDRAGSMASTAKPSPLRSVAMT